MHPFQEALGSRQLAIGVTKGRRQLLTAYSLLPSPTEDRMSATNEHSLGPMHVWDLRDLYPGPESSEVTADLESAAAEAKRFKASYEGKLAALAREGAPFGEAIAAYERLSETLGKLGSYAGLL